MITVEQAIDLVRQNVMPTTHLIEKDIDRADGFVLSKDVFSPINMPPFRQSAMDGYAVNLDQVNAYRLIGEIKAGDPADMMIEKGEAVRIFTGAAVPDSANTIVIQEHIERQDNIVKPLRPIELNMNIRPMGEQVNKGDLALPKGTVINPAAIGFLASLGIQKVQVYKKPSVSLVITGNELQAPGEPLQHGKIYESNAVMLKKALNQAGISELRLLKVEDNYPATLNTINEALTESELVLISGGISVGDYDFVGDVLEELEVTQLFYKVKQKPGKPLFFGKKESKYVFALPGNPASSLSCFYMYVLPAINRLKGNLEFNPLTVKARTKSKFSKKGDRAQFLKAIYKDGEVEILEGQNSSMLHTFALANALVYMPAELEQADKGDLLTVILLT